MEQEREDLVQTVEDFSDGEVHPATYSVENNTIHAQIGGHTMSNPPRNVPAAAVQAPG